MQRDSGNQPDRALRSSAALHRLRSCSSHVQIATTNTPGSSARRAGIHGEGDTAGATILCSISHHSWELHGLGLSRVQPAQMHAGK